MKYIISILAVSVLFSASSFAAKQITREESANYTKIGDLSLTQTGTPSIGHKKLAKEANKKCWASGNVKARDCFYLIVDRSGHESDHKTVHAEVFKK
ncbi:hypothetical protein [Sodalis sp. dw_96]|uniref:hypothetical protein n=1 Tax=Sodalis sp. dw_96 TaxID=2719794 RepID=UPI001BD39F11|nr:hypothetical protein [Sodalis sp. dw_96]